MERFAYELWLKPRICHDLFHDQFAFIRLPGHGCTVALTLLLGLITAHIDKGGVARLLALDLSKAFDRVLHQVCIQRLIDAGVCKEGVAWIENYLSCRFQRVVCGHSASAWVRVTCGVPQGSVLGPILFSFFIAPLRPRCDNMRYIKFADDLSIVEFTQPNQSTKACLELGHVSEWCNVNGMLLNHSKSQYMVFGRPNSTIEVISINGNVLTRVDSLQLLGVFIQSNLKWNLQVDYAVSRASRSLFGILQLSRASCTPILMWHVYTALIRSILTYAFPACCGLPDCLFSKLEKVEKLACRMMQTRASVTLSEFCNSLCVALMRAVNIFPSHPLRELFIERFHPSTRTKFHLIAPLARTAKYGRSFIRFYNC